MRARIARSLASCAAHPQGAQGVQHPQAPGARAAHAAQQEPVGDDLAVEPDQQVVVGQRVVVPRP